MNINIIGGFAFFILATVLLVFGVMNILGRTTNKNIQALQEEDRLPAARFNGFGLIVCAAGCVLLGIDLAQEILPFAVTFNAGYIGLLAFAVGWVIKGFWRNRVGKK